MRLYSLTLNGFRRFADTWTNLEDNVIALVGPNEAGKSSVLSALQALEHDDEIPVMARTRGMRVPNEHEVITARFRLDREDLVDPPYPVPKDAAVWLIVAKAAGGQRHFRFVPSFRRPLGVRRDSKAAIEAVLQDQAALSRVPSALRPGLTEAVALLDTDEQALSGEAKAKIQQLAAMLLKMMRDPTTNPAVKEAVTSLRGTVVAAQTHEQLPSPDEYARIVGKARMPLFVEFNEDNRILKSEYPFGGDGSAAFTNFCALAGLNPNALKRAYQAHDSAGISEIFERAETLLASKLSVEWSQAKNLRVKFDHEQAVLKLNVKSEGGAYHTLGDRSDGLRTFIALRAFLAQKSSDRPIVLLVDEAETHLHYDAQADLVRVFEGQRDAQQVIYSTHSLGCLPQDLGRGVRAVVPDHETHRSELDEAWTRKRPGVAPLMAALGAATVSLTPSRHIVIAEGPSDALLLPTLFREAGGLRAVPFQTVSGFAAASEEDLKRLAKEAENVAFLADDDKGGTRNVKLATDAGIAKRRIVQYPDGLCLEDLIDPDLYVEALNSCFASWGKKAVISIDDLSLTGRPATVRKWCRTHGVDEDDKMDVIQEVLRLYQASRDADRRLSDRSKRTKIKQLYAQLLKALRIPAAEAKAFSTEA